MTDLHMRGATDDDRAAIRPFLREIFAAGETCAVPTDVDETAAYTGKHVTHRAL